MVAVSDTNIILEVFLYDIFWITYIYWNCKNKKSTKQINKKKQQKKQSNTLTLTKKPFGSSDVLNYLQPRMAIHNTLMVVIVRRSNHLNKVVSL